MFSNFRKWWRSRNATSEPGLNPPVYPTPHSCPSCANIVLVATGYDFGNTESHERKVLDLGVTWQEALDAADSGCPFFSIVASGVWERSPEHERAALVFSYSGLQKMEVCFTAGVRGGTLSTTRLLLDLYMHPSKCTTLSNLRGATKQ